MIKESIFKVIVKTNSLENKFGEYDPIKKAYPLSLKARAENNEANKALIKFLSKQLGKHVRIKSGLTSKEKLVQVV